MKRILLIAVIIIAAQVSGLAQSPGGVGSSVLWLKANAGATPSTQGANVTQWNDQSGSNNHAAIATMFGVTPKNPTYQQNIFNFNPSLRFNGTSSSSFAGLQGTFSPALTSNNVSCYVVYKINSALMGGSGRVFAVAPEGGNDAGSAGGAVMFYMASNKRVYSYRQNSNLSYADNAVDSTILLSTHFTTANLNKLDRNGNPFSTAPSATTAFNANLYRVGESFYFVSEYCNGDIAEVILYPTDQSATATSHNKIESYLALKYSNCYRQRWLYTNQYDSGGTTISYYN